MSRNEEEQSVFGEQKEIYLMARLKVMRALVGNKMNPATPDIILWRTIPLL